MEFVIFLSNTILIGAVLYWCMLASGRKPGTPVTGFFVWRDEAKRPPAPEPAERKRQPGRWEGRP